MTYSYSVHIMRPVFYLSLSLLSFCSFLAKGKNLRGFSFTSPSFFQVGYILNVNKTGRKKPKYDHKIKKNENQVTKEKRKMLQHICLNWLSCRSVSSFCLSKKGLFPEVLLSDHCKGLERKSNDLGLVFSL